MQGKNTGYKIGGQGNNVDGDGFNEQPGNFDMNSPITQHTEQLESEAKIKNQGYQESGSSITKTQIVESRKMDGMIK